MSLSSGTRLGPYQITAQLGKGGMGEVYCATDTNLKRQVAIKVLPEAVAADAERLARFQREAEILASLNHPNIAAIHGLEKSGAQTALVMELVEGPTIADRIAQGAIPVGEALRIATQIAEALEAAHALGIIHRDLKPANIKLRPDGTVKVLDFGLAKAMEPAASASPGVSMSPTITTPAKTQMGMILGTAAYMSPEQARGRPLDRRCDIWALGCVLYEMLTGERTFEGEDITDTLALVVRGEPDWSRLPADLPPSLTMYLKRSLHKDPRQRLDSAQDMRLALGGAFETAAPHVAGAARVAPPAWQRPLPVAAAGAVAALLVAGVVAWTVWPAPEPGRVRRFATDLPEGLTFRNTGRPIIALAPDASAAVYNTSGGLYLRTADALDAHMMPGTETVLTSPVFSPDGHQVAYWDADGQIKRIGTMGGAPAAIADIPANPSGLCWAPDGTILVGQPDGIYEVPATGGTPERIIPAREGERLYGAELLPDGESVLFSATTGGWDEAQVVIQGRGRDDRVVLLEGGSDARYVRTGHLIYALGDRLFGMVFDPGRRKVSGGAVPLVPGVRRASGGLTGAAHYSVSATGELIYAPGGPDEGTRTLVWVDRDGREEPVAIAPGNYIYPRLSPDGTRVALDDRNSANDLWVWDIALETRTRLTVGEAGGMYPVWTPDGARLAFHDGVGNIALKAANNTGTVKRHAASPGRKGGKEAAPYFITPDGTALVFAQLSTPDTGDDIGMIALEDGAAPVWLLDEAFNERNAELSPDGRWMSYQSNESGRFEVYVRPFPNVDDDRLQVSNAGGMRPLWSRDGRELFYLERRPDNREWRLMSAAVRTGDAFSVQGRTPVMDWPYVADDKGGLGRTYDVSPDGRRFLAISQGGNEASSASRVIVVENWFEELRRLVPRD